MPASTTISARAAPEHRRHVAEAEREERLAAHVEVEEEPRRSAGSATAEPAP